MKNLTVTKVNSEINRAAEILKRLKKEYPVAKIALEFENPFELLISTILSAQCTDERVNIVTKSLFRKYKKPQDYLKVSNEELEKDIFSTGFYRQKTKSIKNCCKALLENYTGTVPSDFESLNSLPGVGRKTASVEPGGHLIMLTFALDGPARCSGLDIVQYDAEKLCAELGAEFVLLETGREAHLTPSGKQQNFAYFRFIHL